MVVLRTCDFRTAETAAAGDLDSACAEAHGVSDSHLHCTAESHTAFELSCNVFCYELCVELRVANLNNVNRYGNYVTVSILAYDSFNFLLHLLDVVAAAADNLTGLCAVDVNSYSILISFDLNLRHACLLKLFLEELSDLVVLYKCISENLVLDAPSGIPALDDANAKAVRINFLSH